MWIMRGFYLFKNDDFVRIVYLCFLELEKMLSYEFVSE